MRQLKWVGVAFGTALLLAACGGGDGDQTPTVKFTSMVSFGDSLSDVGTHKVGTVAALGGGLYTVNGIAGAIGANPTPSKNWTELIAVQAGLAAPCPAQTGLDGAAAQGFSVPVVNHTGCYGYAQGGSRVTNPVGPGNKLLGGDNALLGQLTVPVVTQISNHLTASGGSFKGTELVTVMAGGNDIFLNLATISPTVTALVGAGMSVSDATTQASTSAVTEMGKAGAELAGYTKALIVGKGAKYVVVVNLPDASKTPFGYSQEAATQGLINGMVTTFNTQLQNGLVGTPGVIIVDAYSDIRNQAVNPASYALSNVTMPACNLTAPSPNALGSSLVCNSTNVVAGDVSHYLFADTVHPTPYGYKLLAQLVTKSLVLAGWL
ncbi:MAG: SGNH/GDSL hydrolase family protein [Comamonadaceae bacterium]|nr:SGNH/GDSL hydrolase family protein [Comamonadaceae bacterium]